MKDSRSSWTITALKEWQTQLRKIRRNKPHVLSEPEERLLALGSAALDGYDDTFSQLTDVDMKFGVLTDADGQERPLTQSSFSSFLVKRDHGLRKRAFHQFYAEFQDHQFTLASALSYSVKADVFRARARNFPSALEASLFRDDVPRAVYDGLISVRARASRAALSLLRIAPARPRSRRVARIRHLCSVGRRRSRRTVSFDEAIERVLASLAPLGPEYVSTLAEGLRGRWCDRYETKGKRSGAFSSGSYGAPPYILMNYKSDVFSDVYTLAHEAGHSMHTWFAQKTQTFQDYDYPIFLAEVASTFNEELLTHHLLEQTDDPKMRAYIINRQIDDIRGTLFRQTMFAEFEKIIHADRRTRRCAHPRSFQIGVSRALAGLLRRGRRARSGARPRMPAHPAFLQRLLCLQICHRHLRGGRVVGAGPRRHAGCASKPTSASSVRRLASFLSKPCAAPAWT